MNYWKRWFAAAGIRAVRTFAQSFVSMIGVGAAISEVNWGYVASCAAVSAILSLAMSLAGLPELDEELPEQVFFDESEEREKHGTD